MKTKPKQSTKKAPTAKKTPTKHRKLSVRQERFCELIAAGKTGPDAWIEAGYQVKNRDVAKANACEALTSPYVQARIAKLRAPEKAKNALTRDRKRELLWEIAESKTASMDARLRAIAEDSRMQGHYEPEKQQIDHRVSNLDEIRKRAREARSPFARPVDP